MNCEIVSVIAAFAGGSSITMFFMWRTERMLRRGMTYEAMRLIKLIRLKGIDIPEPPWAPPEKKR